MAEYGSPKQLSRPSNSSDSDRSPRTAASAPPNPLPTGRKPRGRPPGSKNKPKPPIEITREASDGAAMRSTVFEVAAGHDVVESIVQHARRRRVGFTLLSASGSIANVTLRHPVSHAPAVSLNGPYPLLALHGSFLPSAETTLSSPGAKPSFGICLAGSQGQVFGGVVGGKVTAATLVTVVAATFTNPSFHKLPPPDHHEDPGPAGTGPMSVYHPGNVASPNPITCQVSGGNWGHTSRSPY